MTIKQELCLYICFRYPEYDAYVYTQSGTTVPLGTLANGELRPLRRQAHQQFDQLNISGMITKPKGAL